ncbi:MAG TPA: hypothetical protein VKM56_14035, partial [Verrucomicrobiae bacterium]|nr:hypothetical protein [Verrucomicrobiae bacterium]
MKTFHFCWRSLLVWTLVIGFGCAQRAESVKGGSAEPKYAALRSSKSRKIDEPPAGFTALFNGKDLTGWWGFNADPRKYWALSEEERAKKREASLTDLAKHWTVENGELVNDGNG